MEGCGEGEKVMVNLGSGTKPSTGGRTPLTGGREGRGGSGLD